MTDFLHLGGLLSFENLGDQGVALVSICGQNLDLDEFVVGQGACNLIADIFAETISCKGHHRLKMVADGAITFFIFLTDHK